MWRAGTLTGSHFILLLVSQMPEIDAFDLGPNHRCEMFDTRAGGEECLFLRVCFQSPVLNLELDIGVKLVFWEGGLRQLSGRNRGSVMTHKQLLVLVLLWLKLGEHLGQGVRGVLCGGSVWHDDCRLEKSGLKMKTKLDSTISKIRSRSAPSANRRRRHHLVCSPTLYTLRPCRPERVLRARRAPMMTRLNAES